MLLRSFGPMGSPAKVKPNVAPAYNPQAPLVSRPTQSRTQQALLSCRAQPEDKAEDASGEPSTSYDPATRRLYQHLQSKPKIGAEYGEGFTTYHLDGGPPSRLDVDTLNEKLRHTGAVRMRHTMKPDEAFGCVFNFDTVVADTRGALRRAWKELATQRDHRLHQHQHAHLNASHMCTERIIMDVLGWTRNMKQAREMSYELAALYAKELDNLTAPQPGVLEWVSALANFNVPCALVSRLDKLTVRRTLERMHLHDHFSTMVTAEDDMDNAAQRYLSAALQLQRPPNLCVVFDDSPEAVAAAHNCTMRAVAVAHHYPAYKLTSADLTCANLSTLTIYNLRRLFANSGAGVEFMDLRKQSSNNKPRSRRIANATLDP